MKYIVGLTGGIGSGKSTIANIFNNLNIAVIDTDIITKKLLLNNIFIFKEISKKFGTSVIQNNRINRTFLKRIIFSSKKKRNG